MLHFWWSIFFFIDLHRKGSLRTSRTRTMKIKELSLNERPRERLLSAGPAALSDGELLAVLLRTGTSQMNVLDVARTLLLRCNNSLVEMSRLSTEQLCAVPGIKKDKAATIMAALELGRRFIGEHNERPEEKIKCAVDAYNLLIPMLKGLDHEEGWLILLDKGSRVIEAMSLGIGSDDTVAIGIKLIIRLALEKGAAAVIVAHNHPSGDPEPSDADIKMTMAIHKACSVCDISFLDHVIVCDSRLFSFAEEKCIEMPNNFAELK